MGRIAVVFNPHAKLNSREPERAVALSEVLAGAGEVVVTDTRDELLAAARRYAQEGPELVGLCGGDGTIHIALSAIVPAYAEAGRPLPTFAFLRGGSMNTIRWNLNLDRVAEAELAELRNIVLDGRFVPRQQVMLVRVNGMYGFFWGVGYATNMLEEYYNGRFDVGPRRAAEVAYRAIASIVARGDMFERLARRFVADVEVDGEPVGFADYGMVLAGTLEAIGIGFRPLYRAREQSGRFHVVTTGLTPGQILAQVHRFFIGKPLSGEPHRDQLAASVRVRAENPLRYQLDGELYDGDEIAVDVGPVIDIATV